MSTLINPYHYYDRLLLWLDGADPYGSENASTPTHNSSLNAWYDKSINRYIFNATSGNEPTYNATDKKLEFDGSEHMTCTVSNFPTEEYHLFVVGSITLTQNSELNVILAGDGTDGVGGVTDFTFVAEHDTDTDSDTDGVVDQVRPVFSYQGLSTAGATSCSSNLNAGNSTVGIFEVLAGSSTTTFTDINNNNSFVGTNGQQGVNTITAKFGSEFILKLMKNNESAEQETVGTIHEILMFNKLLPKQDRLAIQGYFKHKYSLADSVTLAGIDDALVAYDFHPFVANAPVVNDTVITTQSGNVTARLPDIYQGLHKKNPRVPFTFIRLSLDENAQNTDSNFGDGVEVRGGKKLYYFSQEVGDAMSSLVPVSFPCLKEVTPAPVELISTKGVAVRANVTIKLADFIRGDDTVSFFSKFMAQNPYYLGRRIEIFEGFVDDNYGASAGTKNIFQYFDGRREYKIDSMHLDKDCLTIKAKDPLTLGDRFKSKVPKPSRFSLNADLGGTGVTGNINVRHDGTTQTGAGITASSFSDFEETFGVNGTTGFIRIKEEILGYTSVKTGSIGSSPVVQLNITSRAQWGTSASDDHKAEESIQQCLHFGSYTTSSEGKFIDEVAYELLINQAGIPTTAVETTAGASYSWTDERNNWLSTFRINTILSEPREVNKVLAELASSVGTNFFYDDYIGKILMKADTPVIDQSNFPTITDNDIIYNSFRRMNAEKERISRVFYYFGIKNHTEDRDQPKNYKNLYVVIDSETEASDAYGVASNKSIFAYGVTTEAIATAVTQRIVQRYKVTPLICTFDLDVSSDRIDVGDHFFLKTKHNLVANGDEATIEMQCMSITYDSKRQINRIKAKSFSFLGENSGVIVANIDSLNAAGASYSEGSTVLTGTSNSSAGNVQPMTVKIDNVTASGNVTDYTVQDYGKGHAEGDIITFASAGDGNFSIIIGSGFFAEEGTGLGTTASPYTGNRLSKSYISCDSAIGSENGGEDSKQFITATLLSGGSGYTNGVHDFTGTEIQGVTALRGTGLTLSVTVSGNTVTAVSVTSNPESGSERAEAGHKGYTDGVVLNLVGHGGSNAQIRLTPEAKMSNGGEPYIIV